MHRAVHIHLTRDSAGGVLPPEAAPRPVYAHMPLARASHDALEGWARSRGVRYAEPSMHVTTAYTQVPVRVPRSYRTRDNAAGLVVPPGGRRVEMFGACLVLLLDCPELQERWQAWRSRGASWDYPDYQPHVTFCDLKHNGGCAIDVRGAPFDEPITLLPEVVSRPRESY